MDNDKPLRMPRLMGALLLHQTWGQRLWVWFVVGLWLAVTCSMLMVGHPAVQAQQPTGPVLQQVQAGKAYYRNHQYQQAAQVWEQAAQAFARRGDRLHQGMALTYLSLAHQGQQQWAAAETAIATSLSLLDAIPAQQRTSTWLQLMAKAHNTQGRLQLALGRPEQALTSWQRATQHYQQLQDQVGVSGSLMNQALAQSAAGLYRPACKTLLQAMDSDLSCDVQTGAPIVDLEQVFSTHPDPRVQVLGLRNLSNIWRQMGDLVRSQTLLQTSLERAQPLQDPALKSAIYLSLAETEQALYHQERQQSSGRAIATQALAHYQQAADLATTIAATEQQPATQLVALQAQLQQLSLHLDLQTDPPQNARLLDRHDRRHLETLATQLSQGPLAQLPPSRTVVYAHLNLARSLFRLGQFDAAHSHWIRQARQWATRAHQQAEALQDARAISLAQGTLGAFAELQQQTTQAQAYTEQALTAAQAIQATDLAYQWHWQLGRLQATQQHTQTAIRSYQAALDTLKTLRQDLVFLAPDAQFSFQDSVEPLYRELATLLLAPAQPSAADLRQARSVIDALQVAEVENYLLQACATGELTDIDQLVDRTDATAAFIYTIILDDRLDVILKLPQTKALQLHQVPVAREAVNQTLAKLRRALQYKLPSRLSRSQAAAEPVYDWLVAPFEDTLRQKGIKNLVFVLDGALRDIPMAALYDGQRYLIEQYAVSTTPGLQLLGPQPLDRRSLPALVAGSSVFQPSSGLPSLPAVGVEVERITETLDDTEVLLNQAFTREALSRRVTDQPAPIVHIATHGQFSSQADQTFLVTGNGDKIDINQLGQLLSRRDRTQPAPIELLFLSACQTVVGDKRATLGMAGMAVRSGARSTIASLWYADDEASAELVGQFYQHLADPNVATKAEALRLAQLDLLKSDRNNLPVYWAPYILLGNWL